MESKKNGLVWVLIVIIVALLGLVGYLGYNLYSKKDLKSNDVNNSDKATSTTTTTTKSNNEINSEVLEGENTELSKIVNDYIATLEKTDVEKEYNVTKVAHVVEWDEREEKLYEIVIEYYINSKKIDITSKINDYTAENIKNFKNNDDLIIFLNYNLSIEKFSDLVNNDYYYLFGTSNFGNGVVISKTNTFNILNSAFNKIGNINAMTMSNIWYKNGNSILSNKEINVELKNNKIYSLGWKNYNACEYGEYETYIENGQIKENIIQEFEYNEIVVTGEKC